MTDGSEILDYLLDAAKLCFVDTPWAWFTTQPLTKQWGDGWGKVPYEHNASPPWTTDTAHTRYYVVRVAYTGDWWTPRNNVNNSGHSVEEINGGTCAWLRKAVSNMSEAQSVNRPYIMAGTTLREFKAIMEANRGDVYMTPNIYERTI